jgi:hypothetical protein
LWRRPRPKLGCGAKGREEEPSAIPLSYPGSCAVYYYYYYYYYY